MTNRRIQINAAAVILLGSLAFMGPLSGAAVGEGEVNCNEYQCVQLEPQCEPMGADAFCLSIGCGVLSATCDDGEDHDCGDEKNSAVLCTKD